MGPLATNGIEAGVKVRPTEDELNMMDKWPCPEFRSGWDSYFKNKPDKPVMHYSVIAGWFGDHLNMPAGKFFTMVGRSDKSSTPSADYIYSSTFLSILSLEVSGIAMCYHGSSLILPT